jgi:molecular chaperone HtpG
MGQRVGRRSRRGSVSASRATEALPAFKPILEINPRHPSVKKPEAVKKEAVFEDVTRLLFEQDRLSEGMEPKNPSEFNQRLTRVLERRL